jgi:NADH dehydrogenase [ubiquinone] 1 alpha subcomplex assembly factor 6
MEKYAEETASSLLYLSLECLGSKDVNFDHAASHLGKAVGICTFLKGTAYHIKKRTIYLPLSLLAKVWNIKWKSTIRINEKLTKIGTAE